MNHEVEIRKRANMYAVTMVLLSKGWTEEKAKNYREAQANFNSALRAGLKATKEKNGPHQSD